jgi:hypothetical protein
MKVPGLLTKLALAVFPCPSLTMHCIQEHNGKTKQFTEDDTFRVLSRPSFEEMTRLYHRYLGSNVRITVDKFFKQHKWTFDEYITIKWDHEDNDWKMRTLD